MSVRANRPNPIRQKDYYYLRYCMDCNKRMEIRKCDMDRHKGYCRSCAAKLNQIAAAKKAQKLLRSKHKPYSSLYRRLKQTAEREGRSLTLTYEDFLEYTKIGKCQYCHDSVTWAEYNLEKNGFGYNLDRMDNSKGYSKNNCTVCCKNCNRAKASRYSYEEWHGMTEYFRKKRGSCGD